MYYILKLKYDEHDHDVEHVHTEHISEIISEYSVKYQNDIHEVLNIQHYDGYMIEEQNVIIEQQMKIQSLRQKKRKLKQIENVELKNILVNLELHIRDIKFEVYIIGDVHEKGDEKQFNVKNLYDIIMHGVKIEKQYQIDEKQYCNHLIDVDMVKKYIKIENQKIDIFVFQD